MVWGLVGFLKILPDLGLAGVLAAGRSGFSALQAFYCIFRGFCRCPVGPGLLLEDSAWRLLRLL